MTTHIEFLMILSKGKKKRRRTINTVRWIYKNKIRKLTMLVKLNVLNCNNLKIEGIIWNVVY